MYVQMQSMYRNYKTMCFTYAQPQAVLNHSQPHTTDKPHTCARPPVQLNQLLHLHLVLLLQVGKVGLVLAVQLLVQLAQAVNPLLHTHHTPRREHAGAAAGHGSLAGGAHGGVAVAVLQVELQGGGQGQAREVRGVGVLVMVIRPATAGASPDGERQMGCVKEPEG